MAHFAELDINNKVIRVLTACNQDIANNGGELSEQAANYFGTYTPHLNEGVKWVQTSYNNNFRKKYAGIGDIYDPVKNKFISPQPFASWSLDSNDDWQAPVAYPTDKKNGNSKGFLIYWDEINLRWLGKNLENNEFLWISESSSWILIVN